MVRTSARAMAAGLALTGAFATAACGGDAGSPATSTSRSGTASTPTTSPTGSFPVRISRTGGLIGFNDQISVAADGTVTGTTKGVPVSCSVAPATTAAIATAASGRSGTTRAGSDQISIVLASAAGTVLLGEGSGSDEVARAVNALLNDLRLAPGSRTVCT